MLEDLLALNVGYRASVEFPGFRVHDADQPMAPPPPGTLKALTTSRLASMVL
ncbi:hypothetical protein [Rhizobium sp. Leaf306]|uniref:hypothetical protein n=1 Tax=Rhizobium sp. Leaf306 TaxID=1736330 RepID=UPI000A71A396|nr:hypothetical protein [Rhizobium sp. Leaf306]